MRVLVLNTGSSSVKYELIALDAAEESLTDGLVEGIGEATGDFPDHATALSSVMEALDGDGLLDGLDAVGHRMVHGGEDFTAPTLLDDDVVRRLEALSPLAPLHNPPALEGVRVARELLADLPHVAVFDTAFHATLPPASFRYAVPAEWYHEHGVRRYGFHGTSHKFVAGEAARFVGQPLESLRMITLHLGNGASACAIDGGRSVATSMGMSPLEGLVMGTRSGDLDPAVVLHLLREGLSASEVERGLNRSSGLRGLAGDNDLRRVSAAAAAGDGDALLALEVYCGRIRRYVGAYLAELGGLDALVFTAGVGQHSVGVRAAVVEPLGVLGLKLDGPANVGCDASSGPVRISPEGASPDVLVVATDEELMIARETARLVG